MRFPGKVPEGQQPQHGQKGEGATAVVSSRDRVRYRNLLLGLTLVLVTVGLGAFAVGFTRGPDLPPTLTASSGANTGPSASDPGYPSAYPSASDPQMHTGIAPLPRSIPTRVVIPSIGVNSSLIMLGLQADGTLQVPPGPTPAGWFDAGPTPGSVGAAVIAGHVTYNGRGVFFHLAELRPGASIQVRRNDGRTAVFTVTSIESFPKDHFPTIEVYGHTDDPELRLVTCAGDYDPVHHNYPNNLVVFAHLTAVNQPS